MENNTDNTYRMFDPLGIGFFILNPQYEILYCNESFQLILDIKSSCIGNSFFRFFKIEDAMESVLFNQKLLNEHLVKDFNLIINTIDRTSKKIIVNIWRDEDKIFGFINNYTQDQPDGSFNKKESNLINSFLDHVAGAIYIKDKQSRFILVNKAKADEHGLKKEDLIGKSDFDFYPSEEAQIKFKDEQEIMESKSKLNKEEQINHINGKCWILTSKAPYFDINGNVLGTFGISWDITELKKIQEELEIAREKAETANVAKSQILSNMSHELRTPLNGIIGISNMLLRYKTQNLTEKQMEGLTFIQQSGNRLLDLINDFLDLSKVEANKMIVTKAPFSLEQMFYNLRVLITNLIKTKELKFIIRKSDHVPDKIVSDEKRIHQILINLLGNAVKFTEKGKIILRVHVIDNLLYFEVIDEGIGISKQDLASVFDEFKQVDSGAARKYQGTGLGLAICKRMVHLLEGNIEIESELNIGTIIRFSIPFNPVLETQILNEKEPFKYKEIIEDKTDRKKILVVDDEKLALHVFKELLSSKGFQVITADEGRSGYMSILSYNPDLIILDIVLPDISGTEMLTKLRMDSRFSETPVILVSIDDTVIPAVHLNDSTIFLCKPVSEADLLYAINKLFQVKSHVLFDVVILDYYGELAFLGKELNNNELSVLYLQESSHLLAEIEYNSPKAIIINKKNNDDINIPDIVNYVNKNYATIPQTCKILLYAENDNSIYSDPVLLQFYKNGINPHEIDWLSEILK